MKDNLSTVTIRQTERFPDGSTILTRQDGSRCAVGSQAHKVLLERIQLDTERATGRLQWRTHTGLSFQDDNGLHESIQMLCPNGNAWAILDMINGNQVGFLAANYVEQEAEAWRLGVLCGRKV